MSLRRRLVLLVAATALASEAAPAMPPLETVAVLEVRLRLLHVGPEGMERWFERTVHLAPGAQPREVTAGAGTSPRVGLRASLGLDGSLEREPYRVLLRCRVDGPAGTSRLSRALELREGATALLEVHAWGDQRLLLALDAKRQWRSRPAQRKAKVGSPVRLALEIERVEGERTILLETNVLHTFLGESVAYAFERGTGEEREQLEVSFRPVSVHGEVMELEVELRGSLPGDPARLVLDRRQTVVVSRGARSAVSLIAGEPPRGYRFLVRPHF